MDKKKFEELKEIETSIDKIDEALRHFQPVAAPARVAVAVGFRYFGSTLYELNLPEETADKLKKEVIKILREEKSRIEQNFLDFI